MKTHKLREIAAKQFLRGKLEPIADEVENALSSEDLRIDPSARQEIVNDAVRTVPFYRDRGDVSFHELPVVDKSLMRSDLASFLNKDLKRKNLVRVSTSGSTGTPFSAYFDREKVLHHRASLIGSYRFMGADPFGPFVFSRAWSRLGPKEKLLHKIKEHLPYSGVHTGSLPTEEVVNWINRRSRVTLIGYSSYIEGLLREIERQGLHIRPDALDAVIGGSEPASSYLESASKKLFGLSSQMRYSSNELGIIAVTGKESGVYHIDTQSFYVEILEEDTNNEALPRTPGRIVVTDLHNRAMPFLRYDTGDLGQFYVDPRGKMHRNRMVNIQGRRLDVLYAGTRMNPQELHPLQIFRGVTSEIPEIRQFQLRQHAIGRFTWLLEAERSELVETRLREALSDVVGPVEQCTFIYVDEVPALASGKRHFFINEALGNSGTV